MAALIRLVFAFVLGLGAVAPAVSSGISVRSPVVLITLENTEYSQIVGNAAANYLNCGGTYTATSTTPGFLCQGTLYTTSYSAQHPSLPNYLDMTFGGDNGCLNDKCPTSGYAAPSLFGQIATSGASFASLQESMPSACDKKDSTPYVAHHNPELYAQDAAGTCNLTDVGVTDSFPSPDAWPNPLPSFSFITPNLCHDAHGLVVSGVQMCATSTGPADNCTNRSGGTLLICNADNWLALNVPALLNQTPRPTVIVTFDEGKTALCGDGSHACGGQVMTAMVGPGVAAGNDSAGPYSPFSLLRGIEGFLGLPCLQAACAAVPLWIPEATGDSGTMAQPASVSAAAVSPETAGLTWGTAVDSDGEPIAGYEVDRSADGGSTWMPMGPLGKPLSALPLNGDVVTTGTNSYADSSVTPGATYSYEVRAVDAHGNASSPTTSSPVAVPFVTSCGLSSGALTIQQCAAAHGMSATPAITLSRNLAAGDFLLAVIGTGGPSTTTFCVAIKSAPAQWTPVRSSPSICSPNVNVTMYQSANGAAQTCPCTVKFGLSAPEDWMMWVGDYASAAASSPLDVSATSDSGLMPSTTMSSGATAITTHPTDLAVAALWNDASLPGAGPTALANTDPGNWSEVVVAAQGGGGWMEVLEKVVASGVTVGAQDNLTCGAKVRGVVAAIETG